MTYREEHLCPLPRAGGVKTTGGGVKDRDAAGEALLPSLPLSLPLPLL